MSDENSERKDAFIIEQQAKFTVDIAQLKEGVIQLTDNMERMTGSISKITDSLVRLTSIVERQGEQIGIMVEHGKETESRLKETNARLNALIEIVERHVSGHD